MATQTTLNTAPNAAHFNKQFYDRKLLETAKTHLVHAKFGQKRSIPKHSGKTVEFRRYELFKADPNALALTEGVTPNGQSLEQTKVEVEVKQYGAYVEVSDLLDMTAYDEVIADSAELLGEQLGTVIEQITRDELAATTNVQYAGTNTLGRGDLSTGAKLTVDQIGKAVRTLKRNKARPFMTGMDGSPRRPHFVCICSPESTYDLQRDELWRDVSKYANAEQVYTGEIGMLLGVAFVESTEAKVYRQSCYFKPRAAVAAGSRTIRVPEPQTAEERNYLNTLGNVLYKTDGTEFCLAADSLAYVDGGWQVSLSENAEDSASTAEVIFSKDAGPCDAQGRAPDVHATLVFGADAFGVVDVDGSGAVETIIKPVGSSGSLDPLNQRATVGAKVAAYAVKLLNPLWMVKIEHMVSA